jgi:two-component system chemotaxis response regulator CheY
MKRILIVDDNAPLGWLLERLLRDKYLVTVMSNGLDACSWLSDGNNCDLIISDINMPSVNGIDLLEYLSDSGIFNTLPVIILSALDDSKDRCLSLGAFVFMQKPFEPQQLLANIRNALESSLHLHL